MIASLTAHRRELDGHISITGSKSESNRLLILKALFPSISIDNLSDSDDTAVLRKALTSKATKIDIHHAGTAMRFLTAYFSMQENRTRTLTGSPRMKERPIKILVDALRTMGANIDYSAQNGYPPLEIKGKKLLGERISIKANVSSQYISALALIAPVLPSGLTLMLEGKLTSSPYLKMTTDLLKTLGAEVHVEQSKISIAHLNKPRHNHFTVESDWSSASYFFSSVALSDKGLLKLSCFREKSLQGDAEVARLFKQLGVKAQFVNGELYVEKIQGFAYPDRFKADLSHTPDLAQTIAVTCFGLNTPCELTGLHTLKIKETDRLVALKTELKKLGAQVDITEDSLALQPVKKIKENQIIETYNDHRMAMAFAPLVLKTAIKIEDPEVVSKSYPTFWEDLGELGIKLKK